MATLVDLATYLDTQLASLSLGTNLFVGRLPDSPDTCVALYEYGGITPTSTFGTNTASLDNPRVQVTVRDAAYANAESLIRSIWTQLEAVANETLSGTFYQRVTAVQSPFPLERDTADRILFVQNFQVVRNYA